MRFREHDLSEARRLVGQRTTRWASGPFVAMWMAPSWISIGSVILPIKARQSIERDEIRRLFVVTWRWAGLGLGVYAPGAAMNGWCFFSFAKPDAINLALDMGWSLDARISFEEFTRLT